MWTLQGTSISCRTELTPSQCYSSALQWLKHDLGCVTTLYPLPSYPLVVYLYPQRAINPQVKVMAFSLINLPSWGTLHWNDRVSAAGNLLSLWDDNSHLIFDYPTLNVLIISTIWAKTASARLIPHNWHKCILLHKYLNPPSVALNSLWAFMAHDLCNCGYLIEVLCSKNTFH